MKSKIVIGVLIFILTVSCGEKEEKFTYFNLPEGTMLNISERFFEFEDKHPVSVNIKDSLAFIIHVQSDTCIVVLNLKARQVIQSLGTVGVTDKNQ
jgi:hypothetical protein